MNKFLKTWKNVLVSNYNKKYKPVVKTFFSSVKSFLLTIHFDFVFILLASYVLTIDYSFFERLMFSVGISYLYHLVFNSVISVKLIGGNK